MAVTSRPEPRVLHLDNRPRPLGLLLEDLWEARALILALGRQGFFVGYRRAALGVLWAVGLPLMQTLVVAYVFSRVVRINTGVNFVAFVFAGMTVWGFFAPTFGNGSTAIVDGAGMASKIYFPRAALPMVRVVTSCYNFAIAVVLLLALSVGLGVRPGLHTLMVIPAAVLMVALTTAMTLTVAALHVYFRDVRFLVQGALTVWFYGTPIFYPLKLLQGPVHTVLLLNPISGVVELFRVAIAGADPDWGVAALISLGWTVFFCATALLLHRRYDRVFSDLL
jgi:lipopolysaccharide transport system permease protein